MTAIRVLRVAENGLDIRVKAKSRDEGEIQVGEVMEGGWCQRGYEGSVPDHRDM